MTWMRCEWRVLRGVVFMLKRIGPRIENRGRGIGEELKSEARTEKEREDK